MRYLWWAEFQKRGALHYHGLVVDAPFQDEREARKWFDAHWRFGKARVHGAIQVHVGFYSASWFRQNGADYVLKDANKGHRKGYQQDYTRMPRGWRTFRTHQLEFKAEEHAMHETKIHTVCTSTPGTSVGEPQLAVWVDRLDVHVSARGGCRLYSRRRRSRPKPPGIASPQRVPETTCLPVSKLQDVSGRISHISTSRDVAVRRAYARRALAQPARSKAGAYTTACRGSFPESPTKENAADVTRGVSNASARPPNTEGTRETHA